MIKNACRRLTCENASKRINCLRSRCCFPYAMDEKSIKIAENSSQNYHKKYEARSCNGKKRTPSTDLRKNIETRYFCCSRCCFAHAMDAKIAQNRRKSSMGNCNASTVGPAGRRANSKCIFYGIQIIECCICARRFAPLLPFLRNRRSVRKHPG